MESCKWSVAEVSVWSGRGTGYIWRVIYGEFSDANSYLYLMFWASTAYNGTTENHGASKEWSTVKGHIPESEIDIEASAKSTDSRHEGEFSKVSCVVSVTAWGSHVSVASPWDPLDISPVAKWESLSTAGRGEEENPTVLDTLVSSKHICWHSASEEGDTVAANVDGTCPHNEPVELAEWEASIVNRD